MTPTLPQDSLENSSQTLLLVEGFTGTLGQDLDSAPFDGVLDSQPWAAIVDSVANSDGGAGDRFYASAPVLTNQLAASRIPDGSDSDATGDWRSNDSNGEGLACCTDGTPPSSGTAFHTPGSHNMMQP